jgi:endonuclease YncB( thermonuclease family)
MIALKRLRIFPLAALVFLATIHAYPQESFTGKVVSVTDGDTIQVMHNGRAKKIRLWGIDTPEKKQAFGTKAKQLTSDLAFGEVVAVEVKDTDRYYIYQDVAGYYEQQQRRVWFNGYWTCSQFTAWR